MTVEPISCMPLQFDHNTRRSLADGPRRLMFAILADAIWLVQRAAQYSALGIPIPVGKPRDTFTRHSCAEARAWIMSDDNSFFSFNNICDVLKTDPNILRECIFSADESHRLVGYRGGYGKHNVINVDETR